MPELTPTLFPYRVDWSEGLEPRRTREWKTDLMPALQGQEQRVRLRAVPRDRLTFTVAGTDDIEAGQILSALPAATTGRFSVPWWPEMEQLVATLASGSTTVPVSSTVSTHYAVGSPAAILWKSPTSYELLTVSAVGGTSLTVSATANTWTAGTWLVPLVIARLAYPTEFDRLGAQVSRLTVTFDVEIQSANADVTGGGATTPVVSTVTLWQRSSTAVQVGGYVLFEAAARDALGSLLQDMPTTWAVSEPAHMTVAVLGNGRVAVVKLTATPATPTVTATVGGVASAPVTLTLG
jgi:hypothetical protein